MIFNHLKAMTAVIQDKQDYPFDLISVLLSWADSEGRINPKFDKELSENFKIISRILSQGYYLKMIKDFNDIEQVVDFY